MNNRSSSEGLFYLKAPVLTNYYEPIVPIRVCIYIYIFNQYILILHTFTGKFAYLHFIFQENNRIKIDNLIS